MTTWLDYLVLLIATAFVVLVAGIAISAYAAERENVRQLREILARLEKIGGCK